MTKWPPHLIEGIEKLIKEKTITSLEDLQAEQGKSVGALSMLLHLAKRIGLHQSLGSGRQAGLALMQILARCIEPSSRLHISNYWPEHYAIEEILKIKTSFNEDSLYANLDWLAEKQTELEKALFDFKYPQGQIKEIYLYDVTSSYFEGNDNELADYGYNRDKKKGKKQIVIGLLCDAEGDPMSVEVFKGNTSDLKTFSSQLEKLRTLFGIERVVMVGDKGMIKSKQIDQISQLEWNYITSITKEQIRTLMKNKIIQPELFDTVPVEVQDGQKRYILRRNPDRALQMKSNREDKIQKIQGWLHTENQRLKQHPRAHADKSLNKLVALIKKLKLSRMIEAQLEGRELEMIIDEEKKKEVELLDGCYVIKTELKAQQAGAQTVHDRYKDLSKVEHAFRTMKTGLEHVRPIFLRKEKRTRAHVFICMLAYKLIFRLNQETNKRIDLSTEQIINSMKAIHYTQYSYGGQKIKLLPVKLNSSQEAITQALQLKLPARL